VGGGSPSPSFSSFPFLCPLVLSHAVLLSLPVPGGAFRAFCWRAGLGLPASLHRAVSWSLGCSTCLLRVAPFTLKEARIFATDIYADPRTKKAAERRIETATQEGLKYNVNAEHIIYVTADELLKGLYEPGELYWKQEGGPMRVHNTSHLRGHVMRE
jgi:hypothetical protein